MKKSTHIPFTEIDDKVLDYLARQRQKTELRYPLMFGLATSFGLVATFYGFEKLIDKVDIFARHPWLILVVGVIVLVSTGAAYRKLN
jgi:hypothetical protein